jgi:hypothetical protein
MGTLVCEGVFEVVLPDGWRASGQPGRTYDLSPERGDLGINISVYELARLPGDDTEELVRKFAQNVGVAHGENLRVVTPQDDGDQNRSFTSFVYEGRAWFAGFMIFPGGGVLATSNSVAGDETALATGERIIASIAPITTKKGLFRRRG